MASSSFFHETVYLKFDEVNIGKSTMKSDLIGRASQLVPISKQESSLGIKKNRQHFALSKGSFNLYWHGLSQLTKYKVLVCTVVYKF